MMHQEFRGFLDSVMGWIKRNPDRAAVLFLILFSCFFVFLNLGQSALIDWDESIYAGVSREMLERKDFLTLYWNKDTFFEKPPLYFWLTSLAYAVFGVNEFSARFWSAVCGVVGVVAVYFFGRNMFGRLTGFVSAMILASTPHWLLQSRNGTLDVAAATLITLTLYFFWKARGNRQFWKHTGIFLGLTFMTKSAVAIIPLLVMLIFAALEIWWDRSLKKYPPKRFLFSCFFVSLFIILPWHLAMYLIHGRAFFDEYFLYHILARSKGIEGHQHAWFFYFNVLRHWARYWYLALLGAFYLLAGFFVRDGVKKHRRKFLLFLWFFLTFLLFSVSRSKIEWYIIPLYPALALLVGGLLDLFLNFLPPRLKILGMIILTIFCFVSLYRITHLWKIDDYNRDIAETAKVMREISRPDDRLAIYGISPGPPIFYSGRKVVTHDRAGIFHSVAGGERLFVLASDAVFEDLAKKGLDEGLTVFKKSGGYLLFGRE